MNARADGSGAMFDAIAQRYDLLNRVNSLGMDRGWRKKTVAALEVRPGHLVVDLATGTADVALALADAYPDAKIVGLDPSEGMLAVGRQKVGSRQVELRVGDAQALPFSNQSVDRISMAFGIRNVPDRALALREMYRVLKPQGRVAILELREPEPGLIGSLARFHVHHVVPRVGAWLSGKDAYRYLQTSIAAFPAPEVFAELMVAAGFKIVAIKSLGFGACSLFVAEVP